MVTEQSRDVKLVPMQPAGRVTRKARAFEAESGQLRALPLENEVEQSLEFRLGVPRQPDRPAPGPAGRQRKNPQTQH